MGESRGGPRLGVLPVVGITGALCAGGRALAGWSPGARRELAGRSPASAKGAPQPWASHLAADG